MSGFIQHSAIHRPTLNISIITMLPLVNFNLLLAKTMTNWKSLKTVQNLSFVQGRGSKQAYIVTPKLRPG